MAFYNRLRSGGALAASQSSWICCCFLACFAASCARPANPPDPDSAAAPPGNRAVTVAPQPETSTSNSESTPVPERPVPEQPESERPESKKAASEKAASETPSAAGASPESAASTESAPAPQGKVLRHAVFFAFKEDASDVEIQEVVDAFRGLPSKIPEIIDFEWGVNNSPEGLNDGFTHCFLLTFKDAAGRAAYLPHEAHKAFGNVLRPHKDKVFVIDYWGDAGGEQLDKELKHAVFFRFKEEASREEIEKVEEAFAALPAKIDAIKRFEWGVNNSPERHDAGFTHCFMVSFGSEEGRAAYLPHPDHQAFVEVLKPVLDGVRVMDYWAKE